MSFDRVHKKLLLLPLTIYYVVSVYPLDQTGISYISHLYFVALATLAVPENLIILTGPATFTALTAPAALISMAVLNVLPACG